MLILVAFALNVALMHLVRTELRVATDAAARAGGRTLSIAQSTNDALLAAQDAASQNAVLGVPLGLDTADIEFGLNSRATSSVRWTFDPNPSNGVINALRITGKRTALSPSGWVPLLFPGVLDSDYFEPAKVAVAMQVDRDISLVLDRSGSMARPLNGNDPEWTEGDPAPEDSRWSDLVSAVDAFLNELSQTPPDEKVAMASFATDSILDHDLSMDHAQIRSSVDQYTQAFYGGMTAIGYGIEDGMDALLNTATARPFAFRTIVVMTDGVHNTGTDPETVAQWAHDTYGVTIHTVTFSNQANQTKMQAVARLGGGEHWHASNAAALVDAFVKIANNTPTILTE
jgi:hypothetical protein